MYTCMQVPLAEGTMMKSLDVGDLVLLPGGVMNRQANQVKGFSQDDKGAYTRTCARAHAHAHSHACAMCACMCTCMCIAIHMYVHTYICTYR